MTYQKLKLIEFDFFIGADGTSYPLADGVNRFVLSFSGYGIPPINYITQQGPHQHGQTVLDYRLQPRVFQIVYREQACNRTGYWNNRASLIDAIKPNRHAAGVITPGTFRKVLPDGSKRDLDGFIQAGPSFAARGDAWDEYAFTETLRFIAHDPLIYNPDQTSTAWTLSAVTGITFPITFPITFSSSSLNEEQTITYNGTWPSFPIITIVGPLNGFSIENDGTGESFGLDYNIADGTTVTITLGYANKTVTDDSDNNLIGSVTGDDFDTFHLAPDPEVTDGENDITIIGSLADDGTQVTVAYYERYIGI